MKKKPLLLNLFLLYHHEAEGREVKLLRKKKKIIAGHVICPLRKLYENQKITKEQFFSGEQYQQDYELASLTHHARPSYDGATGGGSQKPGGGDRINDEEMAARNRVTHIKMLITHAEERFNKSQSLLKPRAKKYRLPLILQLAVEKQMSLDKVAVLLGYHRNNSRNLIDRLSKILTIIDNYYEN